MPKLTTGDGSGDYELIPEGEVISVRVTNVELHTFEWNNEEVKKLNWFFLVTDEGPWKGKEIRGDTSTAFTAHPNCKAYNWVQAITGRAYEDGEELDTDELIGLPCRIIIQHKKPDAQGRIWMRVREVLRPAAGQQDGQPQTDPANAPF
jgi:hypothetical protein